MSSIRELIKNAMWAKYCTDGTISLPSNDVYELVKGHPDVKDKMHVRNMLNSMLASGITTKTWDENRKRNSSWSLTRVLEDVTKPENTPIVETQPTAIPKAAKKTVAQKKEEEKNMAAGMPRQGTPEYNFAKQAEIIERLESLVEKQADQLGQAIRAMGKVDGNLVEGIRAEIAESHKFILGVVEAMLADVRAIHEDNRHVEAAIQDMLENVTRADIIEKAGFKAGFKMAMEMGVVNATPEAKPDGNAAANSIPAQKPRQLATEVVIKAMQRNGEK